MGEKKGGEKKKLAVRHTLALLALLALLCLVVKLVSKASKAGAISELALRKASKAGV